MISRPDKLLIALVAALAVSAIPAGAAGGGDFLANAAQAIGRGDGIAAEAEARKALDAGLPIERVAPYLGQAEMLQGKLADARDWLGPGEFAPQEWEHGFHALALLEIADGDLPAAARAFDRALERSEGSAQLWVDFGRLRYRGGEHHRALHAAIRALEIDPDNPRALEFRAQLARDADGLAAALPMFELALERAPEDLGLLGEYAATLGELGQYGEMLQIARRMVELDPRHPRAYYLQAVMAARAGQDDIARRLLWRTNGAYDRAPAGLLLTGTLELRSGNPALAVEAFDELNRLQPDNPATLELLCRALLANGEANEAAARIESAAGRNDASPYVLTLAGRALEQMGRREQAADYLDRAARAPQEIVLPLAVTPEGDLAIFRYRDQPERGDVAGPMLRRLLSEGRTAEASDLADRLGQRYPGSADVEMLRGDVALIAGELGQSLNQYESAGKIRGTLPLLQRTARVRRLMGNAASEAQVVMAFTTRNPQSAGANAMAARLSEASGDWRAALSYLERASRLGGGGRDPWLLARLAEAQLNADQPEAALASATKAYRLQPSSAAATRVYALALQAGGGDGRAAEALLAKARQLESGPSLARR